MKNIPDTGFEQILSGNFIVSAILAHTGIVGDEDTLLMIDPSLSKEFNDFVENEKILYKFGKMVGKQFVSWRLCLVDYDHFSQVGQIRLLDMWSDPFLWKGETIFCSPHKRIGIEM